MIKVVCIKNEKGVIGPIGAYIELNTKYIYENQSYYVGVKDWNRGYTSHVRIYNGPKEDYLYLIAKFPRKSLILLNEWRAIRINKILVE